MTTRSLSDVLKPTAPVFELPTTQDFEIAEATIGLTLPSDYKDFLQTYGRGQIADFITVFSPISKVKFSNILYRCKNDIINAVGVKISHPDLIRHDLYPKPGGLLQFASTVNSDSIFWVTKGSPDNWKIVVYPNSFLDSFEFEGGITSFIRGLIEGSISTRLFPDDVKFQEGIFRVGNVDSYGAAARKYPVTS